MAQNFQQLNSRGLTTGIKLLVGAGAVAYGVSNSIYTVDGGHRAVIFNRIGGVGDKVFAEGMHFRVPWFQYPIIYEVRSRPRRIASPTGSKDLQTVNITLRVLFRPKETELPQITQELGTDYDERVLPSICNEVLKSVVAQFNASQLITQRESVSRLIRQQLTQRAQDFHLVLDDVSITDLSFSPEYTAAVEAKQVAQQEAQRAQFTVENAKQERAQSIVKAEGVAKSAELIGKQVRENPGFLQLRKIDAAVKVANTISTSANRVFLDSNALLLNVNDITLSEDQNTSLQTLKASKSPSFFASSDQSKAVASSDADGAHTNQPNESSSSSSGIASYLKFW